MMWILCLNAFHNLLTVCAMGSVAVTLVHLPACVDGSVFLPEDREEKQAAWRYRGLILAGVSFFFISLKVLVPSVEQITDARRTAAEMERKP